MAAQGTSTSRWRHDRARERMLWRFYLRWLVSPFVGFRTRWEGVVFYLTLLFVPFGPPLAAKLGLPLRAEDLLWQVPLGYVGAVGLYRLLLFPANASVTDYGDAVTGGLTALMVQAESLENARPNSAESFMSWRVGVDKWRNETSDYVTLNVSPAHAAMFRDTSDPVPPTLSFTYYGGEHPALYQQLMTMKRNLKTVLLRHIERKKW